MIKSKLTILTDPLPVSRDFFTETSLRFARWLKYKIKKRTFSSHPRFRGHFAVTRSLVEGLYKAELDFNYSPSQISDLADTVIVLAGVRTLRQAIRLKRIGIIKRLFVGPNVVNFSTDFDSILGSPEIDMVITPCSWVLDSYVQDTPSLKGRIFSWPAGVDTLFWSPKEHVNRDRILFFEKQNKGPVGPIEPYVIFLRELGFKVEVLHYGSFSHNEYCDLLQKSCLMIGFVRDESQGIAWAEAWSTDVPTLLWRNDQNTIQGRLLKTSTAPYLCERNGLFFQDFNDFKIQFTYWLNNREQFKPRAWTIENMSDEVCAKQLYNKVMQC